MPQAAVSMQYHGHWKSSALRPSSEHPWNLTRKLETDRLAIRVPLDHHLLAGGQNCGRVMQKTRRGAGWGRRGWLTPAAGPTRISGEVRCRKLSVLVEAGFSLGSSPRGAEALADTEQGTKNIEDRRGHGADGRAGGSRRDPVARYKNGDLARNPKSSHQ